MRIVHLSDVHFRAPQCLEPRYDRDASLRNLIFQDAKNIVDADGTKVDLILVSGDIASKGAKEEFEVAETWLTNSAAGLGLSKEAVFVVPGNHDADRNMAGTIEVTVYRNHILQKKGEDRHTELLSCLREKKIAETIMLPLQQYNDFAAKFGCTIWPPNQVFWTSDKPLSEGYHLRMSGLTSALFAGMKEDTRGQIYLGEFQANLDVAPEVINLCMFHHPLDWLEDADAVEDMLGNRAKICISGHKHRQRNLAGDKGVTFQAASVNPDRTENGWEPGYNVIDLNVVREGADCVLNITAKLRKYQKSPEQFVAVMDGDKDFFSYKFHLPRLPAPTVAPTSGGDVPEKKVTVIKDQDMRPIQVMFWELSPSKRREIIGSLKLLTEEELMLPEAPRYMRAFEKARDENLIDKLKQLIKEASKNG